MSGERALFTERERDILSGNAEVKDNYRYKVESIARKRVQKAERDIELLREHHPELYEQLKTVFLEEE